jgi:hypothetical protein
MTRWTLTDEQRRIVAESGDIFVELLTFNHALPPMRVGVGDEPSIEMLKEYQFPEVV